MLLKLLEPIPFWKPFLSFERALHRAAIKKFLLLWAISICPLLFAALAKPIVERDGNYLGEFWRGIATGFSGTHQFIYTVSFIAPILFLLVEKNAKYRDFIESGRRKAEGVLKFTPQGFGWVWFWAAAVFLFTCFSYAHATTLKLRDQPTYLDSVSGYTAVGVYVFALFCWYYSILDSVEPPLSGLDYSASKKASEDTLTTELGSVLSRRKN